MRNIFVFGLLAILLTAALGAAAALEVRGGTVQAGLDATLECDTDGVQVTAWAVNTIPGAYEGIDWVTIGDVNDAACAGNDLVVRVDNVNGTVAYGGAYNASAAAAGPSNATVIPIVAGQTSYKVALHHDSGTANRWFVPAHLPFKINVWIGGPTNVP